MREFNLGDIFEIKVKTNSNESQIKFDEEKKIFVCKVKSLPIENKANQEIVKLFRKQLKVKIEIISGFKSNKKKIKIID